MLSVGHTPSSHAKDVCVLGPLKRQCGRLQCLSFVGLVFRLCTSMVQSTACYGCEVWGAATFAAKGREQSVKGCLQILHEITTVGPSTPTAILLAKLGLHAVFDEWFLGAAKFGTIL